MQINPNTILVGFRGLFWGLLLFFSSGTLARGEAKPCAILCTTYPIYQITRNILNGSGERAELLFSGQVGCPHDYALTPQELSKLSKAKTLIINGLGMEEFLGAPLKNINPGIVVIDSSSGLLNLIELAEESPACEHHHKTINPHLFASPYMASQLTLNIGHQLAKHYKDSATALLNNTRTYSQKLESLAEQFKALGSSLANRKIVQAHGIYDYLARDMGLIIVANLQGHGQEPSAFEMMNLVSMISKQKVGAIFSEPQFSQQVAETVAKATGLRVTQLDPVATGPELVQLDYYERVMQSNLIKIKEAFQVK